MPPKAKTLGKPSQLLRSPVARGLEAQVPVHIPPIDETGGDEGAGIIRGMAIITRGEALGHDLWIDGDFLQQVCDGINATPNGSKARFTHPGLSGDGLGKFTGRVKNGLLVGDVVRGDLHLSKSSRETPDGDLGGYLMRLAKDDPESFGNSIAFLHDFEAERQFMVDNGGRGDGGDWYDALHGFHSPDPDNKGNYPHARLAQLRAVDAVDDPAANPNGLFHRGDKIAADAEALLAFGLGLTKERPEISEFDLDPERFGAFLTRFLDRHKLAITPQEQPMPAPEETKPAETRPADTKPAETEKPAETKPEEKPAETQPAETEAGAKTGADFLSAFGDKGGVWFAQGKTFEQATQLHMGEQTQRNEELAAENAKLKRQLAAHVGETTPLSASREEEKLSPEFAAMATKLGSNGLARFAMANKIHRN